MYIGGRSTRYSDRLHDFSVPIPRCYKDVYISSFFPRTGRLWNSLPLECFPLTYDLNGFKSRIKRHLFFLNWDSLHARLNSHYKAWSYEKKKHKKIKACKKSV